MYLEGIEYHLDRQARLAGYETTGGSPQGPIEPPGSERARQARQSGDDGAFGELEGFGAMGFQTRKLKAVD